MSALLCICAFFLQALVGIALGSGTPCWLLQWSGCRRTEEMKDPRGKYPKEETVLCWFLYLTPSISRAIPSMSKEGLCKHHIVYVKYACACVHAHT